MPTPWPRTAPALVEPDWARAVQLDGPGGPRRRCPHHGDPDLAPGPRRSRRPRPDRAAELPERQRAAPDRRPGRAATRSRSGLRPAAGPRTPQPTTATSRQPRSCSARTSRPPAPSSPTTARGPSTCSASPASSCSTRSTTGVCATGSTPAISSWPTAWRGPTTGAWSSSARSTRGCCRPATCRWPTSTVLRRSAGEAIAMGAAALLVASGCPPGHSPSHVAPRSGVGPGAGGRHPDRVPRRRHGRPHRPELLPQRPARPARLPRRRGELPLGRLHGHPAARPPRRWPP